MKHRLFKYVTIILFIAMVLPTAVWAQDSLTTVADSLKTTTAIPVEAVAAATEEPTVLNSGNTAWIIVATVLVMMMTIPGLALFYGGLVRQKNILSILMQCLMATGIISIIWVALATVGYLVLALWIPESL